MGRTLRRSSRAYMHGVLGNLQIDVQTPLHVIVDSVAADADEVQPVKSVLAVAVKQKYAAQTGEGDTATYELTESGKVLFDQLGGA